MVLGNFDTPHISYYDETNGNLNYLTYTTGWTKTVVDPVNDVGLYTGIALDEFNQPHISYYDATHADLRFAYRASGNWTVQAVDTLGDVGRFTSLALDSDGTPHITYYDATNGDLKFASGLLANKQIYLPLQPD